MTRFTAKEQFEKGMPGVKLSWSQFRDQDRLTLSSEDLLTAMKFLRDQQSMDMLIDVTAVDHLETQGARDRFEVVYCLLSSESGERLLVSVYLNEPQLDVPSMYSLWRSADWLEREVYDMFGIRFTGHPNPKRLLLPEEFVSFPLRKDYPVQGRGERHNFPVITRAES